MPSFECLSPERHLKLYVERESCARSITLAARTRAAEIVRFVAGWNGQGDILVHCKRGVARSTAAAFIIQCMRAPAGTEAALAARLRAAAPHADPCPLLVAFADELLGRNGAMTDAIDDLSPPFPTISGPVAIIPLS